MNLFINRQGTSNYLILEAKTRNCTNNSSIKRVSTFKENVMKESYMTIHIPPTKGMAPQIKPHNMATICRIQCNTSPNWSWNKDEKSLANYSIIRPVCIYLTVVQFSIRPNVTVQKQSRTLIQYESFRSKPKHYLSNPESILNILTLLNHCKQTRYKPCY